jgi:hypothetical protein
MDESVRITITHLRNLYEHLRDVMNLQEIECKLDSKERAAREAAERMPIGPGQNLRDYWNEMSDHDGDTNALNDYCNELRGVKASLQKLVNLETTMFLFHLAGMVGQMSSQFREQLDQTKDKLEKYRDCLFVLCELQKIRESITAHIEELE